MIRVFTILKYFLCEPEEIAIFKDSLRAEKYFRLNFVEQIMPSTAKPGTEEKLARLNLLQKYLEKHYSISITQMTRLDRSVYRIDKRDGESWVVRAFPADRKVERVQGDAEILQFLEKQGFSAERVASPEPVTSPGGQGVIITKYVEGKPAIADKQTFFRFGEMLGQLNSLHAESGAVSREAALCITIQNLRVSQETTSKPPLSGLMQ